MSNTYTVLERRVVSTAERFRTIGGRVIVETLEHAGQDAAYVRLENGCTAWGFGDTLAAAEADAVARAGAI